jgi:hypothetical protein
LSIDRLHLALSRPQHRRRQSETLKKKGPRPDRRGPVWSRVGDVQRTRIPSGPTAKPRESVVAIRRGSAQVIGGL